MTPLTHAGAAPVFPLELSRSRHLVIVMLDTDECHTDRRMSRDDVFDEDDDVGAAAPSCGAPPANAAQEPRSQAPSANWKDAHFVSAVAWGLVALTLVLVGLLGLILNTGRTFARGFGLTVLGAAWTFVLATCVLMTANYKPRRFVHALNFGFLALTICLAGSAFVIAWPLAVLLLLCAALHALWFFRTRPRMPFALVLLKHSARTLRANMGMLLVVAAAAWLQLLAYCLFLGTLTFVPSGAVVVLWPLFGVMYVWVAQVLHYAALATCCTVIGVRCFQKWGDNNRPTASAIKRIPSHFMSICAGSCGVGVAALAGAVPGLAVYLTGPGTRCAWCCGLPAGFAARLAAAFNPYAIARMAMEQKPYFEAARDIREQLAEEAVLLKAELLGPLLLLCSFSGAVFVGAFLGLLSHDFRFAVGGVLLAGHGIGVLLAPVKAYVVTTLVCYLEDPTAVEAHDAAVHDAIRATAEDRPVAPASPGGGPGRPAATPTRRESLTAAPASTSALTSALKRLHINGATGPIHSGDRVLACDEGVWRAGAVTTLYPNNTAYVSFDDGGTRIVEGAQLSAQAQAAPQYPMYQAPMPPYAPACAASPAMPQAVTPPHAMHPPMPHYTPQTAGYMAPPGPMPPAPQDMAPDPSVPKALPEDPPPPQYLPHGHSAPQEAFSLALSPGHAEPEASHSPSPQFAPPPQPEPQTTTQFGADFGPGPDLPTLHPPPPSAPLPAEVLSPSDVALSPQTSDHPSVSGDAGVPPPAE